MEENDKGREGGKELRDNQSKRGRKRIKRKSE
jgi:hypothetical protein